MKWMVVVGLILAFFLATPTMAAQWEVFTNETESFACSKTAGCNALQLIFSPTKTGDYVILATGVSGVSSATPDVEINLTINKTATPVQLGYAYYDPAAATFQQPIIGISRINLTAGNIYNVSMQLKPSSTNNVFLGNARIIVFNPNVSYYNETNTRTTNANQLDVLFMNNTFTTTQVGDYIILWSAIVDVSAINTQGKINVSINTSSPLTIGETFFSVAVDTNEKKDYGGMYIISLPLGTFDINMSFRRTDASAGTFGLQYGRILVFPLSLFTNNYFISDNSTITTNTPVAVVNNTYTPTNNKFHLKIASFDSQSTGATASPINVTILNVTGSPHYIFSSIIHHGEGEADNVVSNLLFWGGNLTSAQQKDSINSTRVSGLSDVNIKNSRLLTLEFPDTQIATFTNTVADTSTPLDSITKSFITSRAIADLQTPIDSFGKAYNPIRTLSNIQVSFDAYTRGTFIGTKTTSDLSSSLDSILRLIVETKTLSDITTELDAYVRGIYTGERITADISTVIDSIIKSLVQIRTVADIPTGLDAYTRSIIGSRITSSVFTTPDSIIRVSVGTQSLADIITKIDSFARTYLPLRTLSDSIIPLDSFVRGTYISFRTAGDEIIASSKLDLVIAVSVFSETFTDSVATVDSVLRTAVTTMPSLADLTLFTDVAQKELRLFLTDLITSLDAFTRGTYVGTRITSDLTALEDSIIRITSLTRIMSDVLASLDSFVRSLSLTRTMSDFLELLINGTASNFRLPTGQISPGGGGPSDVPLQTQQKTNITEKVLVGIGDWRQTKFIGRFIKSNQTAVESIVFENPNEFNVELRVFIQQTGTNEGYKLARIIQNQSRLTETIITLSPGTTVKPSTFELQIELATPTILDKSVYKFDIIAKNLNNTLQHVTNVELDATTEFSLFQILGTELLIEPVPIFDKLPLWVFLATLFFIVIIALMIRMLVWSLGFRRKRQK